MKTVIRFSKGFIFASVLSILLIACGIFAICVKGINFGLEFKSGMLEEIKVAPAEIALSYSGTADAQVQISSSAVSIVVSGIGEQNNTYEFMYLNYPTVSDMVDGFNTVPNLKAKLLTDGTKSAEGLLLNTQESSHIGKNALYLHLVDKSKVVISADGMRELLSELGDVQVKMIGSELDDSFQIRVGDDGTDPEISKKIQEKISEVMAKEFGDENYVVVKTDFIGSKFSGSLIRSSVILVIATLVLIWIYAAIRFKWNYALASVAGVMHDALILISFITWAQIEFDSLTIAAILTIVGYSINNTIVVLDRIRENSKILKVNSVKELWDISNTEMLSRSLITTITTMLAALSLFIFTTGSMQRFALCMIVGLVSGFYSSIWIAGSVLAVTKRKYKNSPEEKAKVAKQTEK
ncbi:MAG: protein translocase subunit SecF [Treponemataceae bacterium]